MSSSLISVILPTFNRGYCLDRAIQSVVNQTMSNWELIVIDNYSTDNSLEIISSFNDNRIKYFKFSNNGIVAASRNYGIKQSTGKFIALLDSDDWWIDKKLELSLNELKKGADLVYHDLYQVYSFPIKTVGLKRLKSRKLTTPVFQDLAKKGNTILNSSVVVKRDLILKIGGFMEEIKLVTAEDYYGWLMISKFTDKFKKVDDTLGYYWCGGGNLTSPSKTIVSNGYLAAFFANESGYSRIPGWLHYNNSRALLLLGKYDLAKIDAKRAIFSNCSNLVRIKAIITFCGALIKFRISKKNE